MRGYGDPCGIHGRVHGKHTGLPLPASLPAVEDPLTTAPPGRWVGRRTLSGKDF